MTTTYLQKLRLFSRNLCLYLITSTLIGLTWEGIRAVLFNLYLLRLGYGPGFVGLINALGTLVFSVFCLPASAFGTRWGNRRTLIIGVSLMVVGLGLPPLAGFMPADWQSGWLLATSVLTYPGVALYHVNSIPFLMSATGPEERNHAFSVQIALAPLAGFAGSLISGVLPRVFATALGVSPEDPASYGYPMLIAALLLIPGVLALLPVSEVSPKQAQKRVARAGRAPYGLIIIIVLVMLLRFAGRGAVSTFFNVYLDAGLHVPTALIGTLSATARLLSVPVALATPLLIARWGNGRTIVVGLLGIAVSMLPLALIPHWGAAGLGFMGVTAFFSATTAPFRVFSQEIVSPGWRTTMAGALMMGAGLSFSAMALGGGYAIASLGYRGLFLASAGLTVFGALLFWAYFRVPRGELASRSTPDLAN